MEDKHHRCTATIDTGSAFDFDPSTVPRASDCSHTALAPAPPPPTKATMPLDSEDSHAWISRSRRTEEDVRFPRYLFEFRVKDGRVFGKDDDGAFVKVKKLSDLHISLMEPQTERFKTIESAESWTEFFLCNDVTLVGDSTLTCANALKNEVESPSATIVADRFFPYYQEGGTRKMSGEEKGLLASGVPRVHLFRSQRSRVILRSAVLYALGSSDSADSSHILEMPMHCLLCFSPHSLTDTPCVQVLRFLTENRRLQRRIAGADKPGARILEVVNNDTGNSKLCSSVMRAELCTKCHQRAVNEGNMWFKLEGSCKNFDCPNSLSINSPDDLPDRSDYVFVERWSLNNLPEDDVSIGIEQRTIRVVQGVVALSVNGSWIAASARRVAMKYLKRGLPVDISDVMREVQASREVILALMMHDTKLGDMVRENKSFTLSPTTGFVQNRRKSPQLGAWLTGRIIYDDKLKCHWNVPMQRTIVVHTCQGVSTVSPRRLVSSNDEQLSDELGAFIC